MDEKTITERTVWVFDFQLGKWVKTQFSELEPGNIFKMIDGKDRYIDYNTGDSIWIADDYPAIDPDGTLSIKTKW